MPAPGAQTDDPGAAPPPPSRRTLALKLVVGLLVTGALVYVLSTFLDAERTVALARQADPALVLLMMPTFAFMYGFRAARFAAMAPRSSYWTMLGIAAVHNFMLRILPLRTGEISYGLLVRKVGAGAVGDSLVSLLLLRLLDATMVVLIFGVTLALNSAAYLGDADRSLLLAGGFVALCVLILVLFRRLLALGAWLVAGAARLLAAPRWRRLHDPLRRIEATLRGYTRLTPALVVKQMLFTLGIWVSFFALVHLMLLALHIPTSLDRTILGGSAASASSFIPVGGIGTFGVLETGWALGFSLVGVDSSTAVASGFGFSLLTFAYGGLFALAGWIALSLRARARGSRGPAGS